MAKKDDQKNKEVVVQPTEKHSGVTETTGSNESQGTQVAETSAGENVQEKLPVSSEQNSGEQTNGEESAKLDNKSKPKKDGAKGNGAKDPVNEPKATTENRIRIANDVFQTNTHCKVLYFTADLIPFFEKSDAIRHGVTLDDDTIVTINRK